MMALWQEWWVWIVAGVVLAVLEVVVPGYVFLGFAIGVVLTGVLIAAGLSVSLSVLVLIAAVLSLIAWLALRRVFGLPGRRPKIWDRDINDEP